MTANYPYPDMDRERLAVIDNIERAIAEGDSFRRVELHDPVMTERERRRITARFDILHSRPLSRIRAQIALSLADKMTAKLNTRTTVTGLENLLSVKGGCIIVANHFNPMDSTVIRHALAKCGRDRDLYIMVEESNLLMKGVFGFLMRNCNTVPVCKSPSYLSKRLKPAISELMAAGKILLIYPEEQMWFNYRKPRPHRIGAYYYAVDNSVPVIPVMIEMTDLEGYEENGFHPVAHTAHILKPITPEPTADARRECQRMQEEGYSEMLKCYREYNGAEPTKEFYPERDIAGYVAY